MKLQIMLKAEKTITIDAEDNPNMTLGDLRNRHKCKPAVKVTSMTLGQATRWLDNFLEARGFK